MISTTPLPVPIEPLPFVVCSTVTPESINWLWNPYIPRKALTSIIGDGGFGKSYMTCAIAADLSAGRPLPGQEAKAPQRVMMISAEDGLGPIILPRLQRLDANLENISVYDEGFTINPRMCQRIVAAVDEFDAAVLFLDPMVVYLGGEVDSFKANEVRSILSQLTDIAKKKDIAIVCVHHVKKGLASGQHKSLGSVDFVNGVRSTILVDATPTGQYYIKHVKHNWSQPGPSLAYGFNADTFYWHGAYNAPETDGTGRELSKTRRGVARTFLINILKDGQVHVPEILKLAKDNGITESALERAKPGVAKSVRRDDKWWWELNPDLIPHPVVTDEAPSLTTFGAQAPGLKVESPLDELVREARARMQ